jgi:RNA polymerase sigma-70 factor (ECF subfamily)
MGLPLKLVKDNVPGNEPRHDQDIKDISQKDRSRAFDMLVSRYQKRLYYHALYITKNSETAMDVAQEVFVKAFHEPRLFESGFHTKAWLFRVCTNRCYNLVRDRQRRGGILERIGKERDGLGSSSHQAIDELLAKEQSSAVSQVLERLSPEHRTILLLRYFGDLSYDEIATVLEVRIGTVMSRLSRAKVRLYDLLSEEQKR